MASAWLVRVARHSSSRRDYFECARRGLSAHSAQRANTPTEQQAQSSGRRTSRRIRWIPDDDKTLAHFMPRIRDQSIAQNSKRRTRPNVALSVEASSAAAALVGKEKSEIGCGTSVFIETRGCQMNVADSDVVRALLLETGYTVVHDEAAADVLLINTCAIREKAEEKVWQWLYERRAADKKAGRRRRVYALLGCMAERLKQTILERDRLVDVVVGPDAYRDLPLLLSAVVQGEPGSVGYNVQLSLEETYADVTPLRENVENRSAFVSIARSCGMHCTFCIVPYTRGPERSRPLESVVNEVRHLINDQGVREITLVGQNVNSWRIESGQADETLALSPGFSVPGKARKAFQSFPDLLDAVSSVDPEVRVRFTSPHPAHFPNDVLQLMAERNNICSSIHMPAQSGSDRVLELMRRRYTSAAYRSLVAHIRHTIPGVSISTDMISGFCGETLEDHEATLQLLRDVRYESGFFFAYSPRDKTEAARSMEDDVPHGEKQRRLREVIDLHHVLAHENNQKEIGNTHLVLVEHGGARPRKDWPESMEALTGRTDTNKRVVFPNVPVPTLGNHSGRTPEVRLQVGDYVAVRVREATSVTLFAEPLLRMGLQEFFRAPALSEHPHGARMFFEDIGARKPAVATA